MEGIHKQYGHIGVLKECAFQIIPNSEGMLDYSTPKITFHKAQPIEFLNRAVCEGSIKLHDVCAVLSDESKNDVGTGICVFIDRQLLRP